MQNAEGDLDSIEDVAASVTIRLSKYHPCRMKKLLGFIKDSCLYTLVFPFHICTIVITLCCREIGLRDWKPLCQAQKGGKRTPETLVFGSERAETRGDLPDTGTAAGSMEQ